MASKFAEGEKVLCFHGPLLYEARCHKVNSEGEVDLYLIHYSGWSQKWDEWIPETRILKYSEANLKKQLELRKHHNKQQNRNKKKNKTADACESEDAYFSKVSIRIDIPGQLKLVLLDDWDLITQQKHLVTLPSQISISQILDEYRMYSISNEEGDKSETDGSLGGEHRDHVLEGILGYFSRLLGMQLLYKFERPQYADVLEENKGKPVYNLYGIEHLLRLFTKIGDFLAFTELDINSINVLQHHINSLLQFIDKHRDRYITTNNYEIATPDYLRRAGV